MPTDAILVPVPSDDEDTDGCLCGLEHSDDDVTLDEELPIASGGVEVEKQELSGRDEDDLDGCKLDFTAGDQTTDEELPVATGGT
jgi:hypothetical protein